MSHRFFVNHSVEPNVEFELDPGECHHLLNVMRAQKGDAIELFDGSGMQFAARIETISRKRVTVIADPGIEVNREIDFEMVVGIPLPKSDRQKFLVEKCTEIGVTRLLLLETARSSVKIADRTITKLERLVVEASKQCGRNRLLQIEGPKSLIDVIQDPEFKKDYCRKFAHTALMTRTPPDADRKSNAGSSNHCVLIGPEGGFDPEEVRRCQEHDWEPLSLGKATLRMETAAVVAATLLSRNPAG